MVLTSVALALGLTAVAQARGAEVSPEFQAYVVKLLTEAESRCLVAGEGWASSRQAVREGLGRSFGSDLPRGWPQLRARVEGSRRSRGYTIELVTAEFWPGVRNPMYVFVPDGAGPFPAVVLACAGAGARSQLYHGLAGALARRGILVLGIQPIGKGVQGPVYRYNGIALLAGTSIAQEQFHTATRALDYLLLRPDVDATRIGITGDSCGGWTALFTAAMDPRVAAVAPASTNYTFCGWLLPDRWRTFDSAEGNLPEILTYGANIPVVTACTAPRWFRFVHSEYEGDRLQYIPIIDAAARGAYALAGASGRYSSRIEPCPHGLWPVAQIGLVDWFCEVLRGCKPPGGTLTLGPPPPGSRFATLVDDGVPVVAYPDGSAPWKELEIAGMPADDAAGLDGRGFLRIVEGRRRDARAARAALAGNPPRMRDELRRCLGLPAPLPNAQVTTRGDEVLLETEPGLHVLGRWVKPPKAGRDGVALVVGRADDRRAAGDLTARARFDLEFREEGLTSSAISPLWAFAMLNRPPLGMWVWDALSAAEWLRREGHEVELIGVGDAGALIAPMAAALSRDVARARVVTTRLPSLDEDVVTKQVPHTPFWAHRLLWVADVPELVALLKSQGRW
jgi:dienelactone hydrolase